MHSFPLSTATWNVFYMPFWSSSSAWMLTSCANTLNLLPITYSFCYCFHYVPTPPLLHLLIQYRIQCVFNHFTCIFNHFTFDVHTIYDTRVQKVFRNVRNVERGHEGSLIKQCTQYPYKDIVTILIQFHPFLIHFHLFLDLLLSKHILSKHNVRWSCMGRGSMHAWNTFLYIFKPTIYVAYHSTQPKLPNPPTHFQCLDSSILPLKVFMSSLPTSLRGHTKRTSMTISKASRKPWPNSPVMKSPQSDWRDSGGSLWVRPPRGLLRRPTMATKGFFLSSFGWLQKHPSLLVL